MRAPAKALAFERASRLPYRARCEMAEDERSGYHVRPTALLKALSLKRLSRRTYPLREEARRKG